MAKPRRRSARLSQTAAAQQSSARKTPATKARLNSLLERDETPEVAQPSIDGVLNTPTTTRDVQAQLSHLSNLTTPKTEPRAAPPEEMHPKTIHQTTSKAPDSGLKLGFADISSTTGNHQNTPSKSSSRQSTTSTLPRNFEFKFSSDANLSAQAKQLMDNVREDAARIKAQMAAERSKQDRKDGEAEKMFGSPRKIANAKGRAGRFSDVHMAQFKKMDSIANHPSSFRARPGYTAPTTQSLKRSPSKAGLDDSERPRVSDGSTARKIPPPIIGRVATVSPFKSVPSPAKVVEKDSPAKRARIAKRQDGLGNHGTAASRPVPSDLYSPTKASLARTAEKESSSPQKASRLPRSNSVKSLKALSSTDATNDVVKVGMSGSPSKIPQFQSMQFKPLPPIPREIEVHTSLPRSQSVKSVLHAEKDGGFSSKLPTFSGLKSILRGGRKLNKSPERPSTPKRPNSVSMSFDSEKKVDFTPSVKSRYAVKLAAVSPAPVKTRQDTPYKSSEPIIPYDSAAYLIQDNVDESWEDEDGEVTYPELPSSTDPSGPVVHTFSAKAKGHNRRESVEFKSIFTTLHPEQPDGSSTLTSVNTRVNKTNPTVHVDEVLRPSRTTDANLSPPSIRRVRPSISNSNPPELLQPFEDKTKTISQGMAGKKRRFGSIVEHAKSGTDQDAKENQYVSDTPVVPGGWNDAVLDEEDARTGDTTDDEGAKRGGKRTRFTAGDVQMYSPIKQSSPVKKPNAARETAAKTAKERKGRGVLSLSRLNMLSRPKQRN